MSANHVAPKSAVAALCLAHDKILDANGWRPGGGHSAAERLTDILERRILQTPSTDPVVLVWKANRLAHALQNEWREDLIGDIVQSIERSVAALGDV